ncbi:MAG: hypothetical protein JNK05_32420 [Myxococcales bacterium]|nr:hypothetical protein [Myxococcales bacterium]
MAPTRFRTSLSLLALPLALVAFVATLSGTPGCGPASGTCIVTGTASPVPADPLNFNNPTQCTTGRTWACLNTGANFMNPGQACIDCHRTRPGAPRWSVGGTVYASNHEPNNCLGGPATGSDPVEIVLQDKDNNEHTTRMLPGGNFYFENNPQGPFTRIQVRYQGRTRSMPNIPNTHGDCNLCHTERGLMGAPGRIVLP